MIRYSLFARCLCFAAASVLGVLRGAADVSRFDERIAADRSQADSQGLEWVDGLSLPLESKAFADTPDPYGRIAADLLPDCPEGVRYMARQSTGHYFLFATDSSKLAVEWVLEEKWGTDPYIPPQGLYGIDIYDTVDGKWRFVRNGRLSVWSNETNKVCVDMPGKGFRPVRVYLPTRGVVRSIRIGLEKGARLEQVRHPSGIVKPVVHYGTSIVHGGCASRPGLCFTSIAGRLADAPYVNMGFSGCAKLEPHLADVLARIDASLYVVDPVWNCTPEIIRERLEPFLRKLHAAHPGVPLLVCEGGEPSGVRSKTNEALKEVYDRLAAEKSTLSARLNYLPAAGMIQTDGESTHDYCHPNDYGSVHMGKVFARAIRNCLKTRPRGLRKGGAGGKSKKSNAR